MGIIIGLDVGSKRVGVALSDSTELIASPHDTLDRAQNRAEQGIIQLVATSKASALVVGLPLNDDNSESEQCQNVKNFCRRLLKRVNIELYYVDEFGSSMEAEAKLRSVKSRKLSKGNKGAVDAAAAAIILQEFLDSRRIQAK
jgi:putative Holliday junction resolvase